VSNWTASPEAWARIRDYCANGDEFASVLYELARRVEALEGRHQSNPITSHAMALLDGDMGMHDCGLWLNRQQVALIRSALQGVNP
jgi:hypothetical protein